MHRVGSQCLGGLDRERRDGVQAAALRSAFVRLKEIVDF